MSGECDECGEHCLDCRCNMRQGDGIKIWAQMFFEDGTVTRGVRIPAEWLDEGYQEQLSRTAETLLQDLNRDEGWLLLWGAGNVVFEHYPISSSSASELSGSDSSA